MKCKEAEARGGRPPVPRAPRGPPEAEFLCAVYLGTLPTLASRKEPSLCLLLRPQVLPDPVPTYVLYMLPTTTPYNAHPIVFDMQQHLHGFDHMAIITLILVRGVPRKRVM